MDESTIEIIERPSTPAEAVLHRDIQALIIAFSSLVERHNALEGSVNRMNAQLVQLGLLKRPGDE